MRVCLRLEAADLCPNKQFLTDQAPQPSEEATKKHRWNSFSFYGSHRSMPRPRSIIGQVVRFAFFCLVASGGVRLEKSSLEEEKIDGTSIHAPLAFVSGMSARRWQLDTTERTASPPPPPHPFFSRTRSRTHVCPASLKNLNHERAPHHGDMCVEGVPFGPS